MSYPQPPADYPAGYHPYQPGPTPRPRNGYGTTALALALVGLVFGLVPFTGFLALILGALAVLFGLLNVGRIRRGEATSRVMTAFGAILGVGVAALGIWGMTIVFGAVEQLDRDLGQLSDDLGGDPAAMGDVTVTDCSVSSEYGFGSADATVTITNTTAVTQSYWVTISVNDAAGVRIGEVTAISNSLAAGQSATEQGMGTAPDGIEAGSVTCVVADVNRMALTP